MVNLSDPNCIQLQIPVCDAYSLNSTERVLTNNPVSISLNANISVLNEHTVVLWVSFLNRPF